MAWKRSSVRSWLAHVETDGAGGEPVALNNLLIYKDELVRLLRVAMQMATCE
jgi:hypothetical protein